MQWQLGDGAGLPLFLFTQAENGHIQPSELSETVKMVIFSHPRRRKP